MKYSTTFYYYTGYGVVYYEDEKHTQYKSVVAWSWIRNEKLWYPKNFTHKNMLKIEIDKVDFYTYQITTKFKPFSKYY